MTQPVRVCGEIGVEDVQRCLTAIIGVIDTATGMPHESFTVFLVHAGLLERLIECLTKAMEHFLTLDVDAFELGVFAEKFRWSRAIVRFLVPV